MSPTIKNMTERLCIFKMYGTVYNAYYWQTRERIIVNNLQYKLYKTG